MKKHAIIVTLAIATISLASSSTASAYAAPSSLAPSSLAPTALAPTALAPSSLEQAGAKTEVPDKRPEVAGMIDKLDKHVDKHGSEDTDATALIAQLEPEFGKSGPKDKAAIVKALAKCVEAERPEPKKGEFNNKLAIAAAEALGAMGPESVATLIASIGQKNLRRDIQLQRQLILSLGKTHDQAALKTLTTNLENKDAPLVAAAAEALGEFGEVKLEVRKELFSSTIKCLMSAKNAKDAEQSGSGATAHTTIATERYDVVSAPLLTTLHKLSKHDESTPELWERWWNKNRQANWDAGKP